MVDMIFIFKWEVLCNRILFNQKISLSRKLFVINGSSVVFIENSDIFLVFFTFVLTITTKYRCIQLAILHFRLRWHNLWNKCFLRVTSIVFPPATAKIYIRTYLYFYILAKCKACTLKLFQTLLLHLSMYSIEQNTLSISYLEHSKILRVCKKLWKFTLYETYLHYFWFITFYL